ncbi:hypothetical protein HYS91_04390 [Candidatus Daviesbacteria bacterium]|nr:hypothetical protein [Candidatus Daviesbacteria bacterium]
MAKITIFVFIVALIIRLTLATLPGMVIDMSAWFAWAVRLNEFGFSKFYSDEVWTNYLPGYLYILAFLGAFKNFFSITDYNFYYLLKMPAIIADLILAFLVFKLLGKKKLALFAAIVVLFNPAFLFNSSIWGQIDSILTLFLFLSIYYLNSKRLTLSSIFIALAILIKPQAIALVPVYCFYLLKYPSLRHFLQLTLSSIAVIFFLSLPFFPSEPILGIWKLFFRMVEDYQFISLYAYNFWGMIGFWINDSTIWQGISYKHWGYILLIFYWLIIFYSYFKRKFFFFSLSTLAFLSFFFLPTRVHERYLYPALIFLIIFAIQIKNKWLILLYFILSLIHFLNLYYVYIYYNEFYLSLPKVLYIPFLYFFAQDYSKILSLLSTVIFYLVTIIIIKEVYAKK